jgi:seryl-tRNA synthetase
MLARELFRTDPERIRDMLAARHTEAPLDRLLEVDASWREVLVQVEELKARRNVGSKEIGGLYRDGREEEAGQLKAEMTALGEEIKGLEQTAKSSEEELRELELQVPNLFDASVPIGADEEANRVERSWGEHPKFDFEPKAHWDLGPDLGIIDFERAAKVASSRFAVLRGPGAALERALISYMLDLQTGDHGYTEIIPPYLVNATSLYGTGQLPKFADDVFRVEDFDLSLIPTAEVPLTNLHRDETLDEEKLPVRYCASTPCFRAEAGSHGRDVRGLIRQHQFHKVELVCLAKPEDSWDLLEDLTRHAEAVLQGLGLPYRVATLATGDLGFSAAKTYDLEVWLPALGCYREISSCTNFTDFQARRARLRFRPSDGGKARLVHTLNGSALAAGRTMVAVIENYQQADGSVVVPEVLRPYLNGLEVIEPTQE